MGEAVAYLNLLARDQDLLPSISNKPVFANEWRAEKAIEALSKMLELKAVVMIGGNATETDASMVVPGDIIFMEMGQKVPADAVKPEWVSPP